MVPKVFFCIPNRIAALIVAMFCVIGSSFRLIEFLYLWFQNQELKVRFFYSDCSGVDNIETVVSNWFTDGSDCVYREYFDVYFTKWSSNTILSGLLLFAEVTAGVLLLKGINKRKHKCFSPWLAFSVCEILFQFIVAALFLYSSTQNWKGYGVTLYGRAVESRSIMVNDENQQDVSKLLLAIAATLAGSAFFHLWECFAVYAHKIELMTTMNVRSVTALITVIPKDDMEQVLVDDIDPPAYDEVEKETAPPKYDEFAMKK